MTRPAIWRVEWRAPCGTWRAYLTPHASETAARLCLKNSPAIPGLLRRVNLKPKVMHD